MGDATVTKACQAQDAAPRASTIRRVSDRDRRLQFGFEIHSDDAVPFGVFLDRALERQVVDAKGGGGGAAAAAGAEAGIHPATAEAYAPDAEGPTHSTEGPD